MKQNLKARKNHNESSQALNVNYKRNLQGSLDQVEIQKLEKKKLKQQGLAHIYNSDYQPASYQVAIEYRNSRSYRKKLPNGSYRELQLFEDTAQLKNFGLGPYLYIEFQRRISWLFLILALLEGIRIYINVVSNGLKSYSLSFSTFLIGTTLGNYNGNILSNFDAYIMAVIPAVIYFGIFIFFLIWKAHYFGALTEQQENNSIVRPEKFCLEIEGIDQKNVSQEDLQKFCSIFGSIYQISLVRRHKNKLSYFEQLDELTQQIKEQQLQMILGSGDQQHFQALKKQRDELNKYINTLRITPKILSAYIHYQYQKSKLICSHIIMIIIYLVLACTAVLEILVVVVVDDPDPQHLFNGNKVYIRTQKVPEPSDINWQSKQISDLSKFCRIMFGIVVIIVFLALTCTIIGLCTVYISSHSINCDNVVIPSTWTQANSQNNAEVKRCFCNANLIASFNDAGIQTYCGDILNQIYAEQAIQLAITATSAIVNVLFGLIVHWIVNFTRPQSFSSGLLAKTVIYTIFMTFNTVILPLLLYADIFGFKATKYVSFLTIISTDISNFFQVDSITFYVDFNPIWYRNVSPIFTNYIIFDILFTWGFFFVYKCISNKSSLESDQKKILQKHMNQKITSYKFNIYSETAYFNLILIMSVFYSAGIPVIIPLGLISLFSKYVTNRSLIQSSSSVIEGLSEKFNSFSFILVPILLTLTCLFGEWMLSANQKILDGTTPVKITIESLYFDILKRQLYLPFFIILAACIGVYFLFYNTIVRFCSWLTSFCYNKKAVVHPYHTLPFSQYQKKLNILCSYNIRKNDKFKNAIINLEKHLYDQKD